MSQATPAQVVGPSVAVRFATLAVLPLATLVVGYLVFVQTRSGQRIDDAVHASRIDPDTHAVHEVDHVLQLVDYGTIALMSVLLLVAGLVQRRWRMAISVAVAFGMAVVTAEILKAVLPRPEFGIDPATGVQVHAGRRNIRR